MNYQIQDLLGEFPLKDFISEYLHRLPFSLQGSGKAVRDLGSWATLESMLDEPELDMMVVRGGARFEGPSPRDAKSARALSDEGWTLLVRHAERHHPEIARLAGLFEHTFHGPVDVQMYVTPPGEFGFSWHYDAEDVFILQTSGAKEYYLRKNTVHPWPLVETIPQDMHYERELMPLMRVVLEADDLLYIPCGYWHRAEAKAAEEPAISLAVGVMSRPAVDMLDVLKPRLMESLVWRQRLPLSGAGCGTDDGADPSDEMLRDVYRQLLEALGDDLARTLKEPAVVEAMIEHFARAK